MPDPTADEAILVAAARSGDREAFCTLVRHHQGRLRALGAMAMLPPDDVADIVQDSFLEAWRHLEGFDPARAFGPWLRTICRNRIHNFIRDRAVRRRRELGGIADLLPAPAAIDDADEGLERIGALRSCLAQLTEHQRQVLRLRFHAGLAVQDIARRQGRTANAISVLLLHLRQVLQRCIAERERLAGGPA